MKNISGIQFAGLILVTLICVVSAVIALGRLLTKKTYDEEWEDDNFHDQDYKN